MTTSSIEDTYIVRGSAYSYIGKYKEAILHYDKAIIINPSNANSHIKRGFANIYTNAYEDALLDFECAKLLSIEQGNEELTNESNGIIEKLQNKLQLAPIEQKMIQNVV